MKRALLLLALSSATLVEYDQELVEFICRFYLDSPPFSIAHDDKSTSSWRTPPYVRNPTHTEQA